MVSLQNFMSLGLMWKEMGLDMLVVQCYAPHHSRFNPIERCWAPLTKWLVGGTFPVEINGAVPKESDSEGWDFVLKEAASTCVKFWNNRKIAGHKIHAKAFDPKRPSLSDLKDMHKLLLNFKVASAKRLREDHVAREIYKFLVLHADGKPYQIEFKRCQRAECPHCSSLPNRENELLDAVRSFGHLDTFLSQYNSLSYRSRRSSSLKMYGSCEHGCIYVFFTETDKKRHYRLMLHKNIRVN